MDRRRLAVAVAHAVEETPTSIRALARRAGLAHVTLLHVRDGKLAATPAVARAVARALEGWSAELADVAAEIREALEEGSPGAGGG